MRVMVDLDPRDVWRIQETAERLGVQPGDVLRDELATKRTFVAVRERVRRLVAEERKCDADIAAEMSYTPGRIAQIRRGLGLPANPRYPKRAATAAERQSA